MQAAVGLLLLYDFQPLESSINNVTRGTSLFVYLTIGLYLYFNSANDSRLLFLGTALVLTGIDFAMPQLDVLKDSDLRFLMVPTGALLPYFLWSFFLAFPKPDGTQTIQRYWRFSLLVLGMILVLANLQLIYVEDATSSTTSMIRSLDHRRSLGNNIYDGLVYGLALATIPVFLWRTFHSSSDEKDRAKFFINVMTATIVLPCVFILYTAVDGKLGLPEIPPSLFDNIRTSLNLLLLLNPIAVAYAVVVDEILPTRYLVRQSLRYLIGKYTIILIGLTPVIMLVENLYIERNRTIANLTGDLEFIFLLLLAIVGIYAIRTRETISVVLEKKFFRDRYNLDEGLSRIVSLGEKSSNPEDLAFRSLQLLDQIIMPSTGGFFFLRSADGNFENPENGETIDGKETFLEDFVHYDNPIFHRDDNLEASIGDWAASHHYEVLMPIHSVEGTLIAFLGLKEKRSQDHYNETDRKLLVGLTKTIELTLGSTRMSQHAGNQLSRGIPAPIEPATGMLRLCNKCQLTHPATTLVCCDQETVLGTVPYTLNNRFRIERLLGHGNSGDVFEAYDLDLRRQVAVKMLIKTSIEEARIFRRESIAVAALSNHNLAAIYDAQIWDGLPILIFELMEQGSLDKKLQKGPLGIDDLLRLANAISQGLDYLHQRNFLHRDIKPANIGYSVNGEAKLLDFGLAKISTSGKIPPGELVQTETMNMTLSKAGCVGTPLYWSPEVLAGKKPTPATDVWAMCVVLYEALTGTHPFERPTWFESSRAIASGTFESIQVNCPAALAELIEGGLQISQQQRTSTTQIFIEGLKIIDI